MFKIEILFKNLHSQSTPLTMRKVLLVFAVFVTFVATQSEPDLPESFKDWKKRFNKKYPINGKTQAQAEAIYAKNAARIVKFNKKSNESYTIGMNVNGDMTDNELKSVVQGNSINNYDEAVKVMELKKKEGLLATTARPMNDVDLKASWPKSLDYSSWMQPVKDSGLCLAAGIAIAGLFFVCLVEKNLTLVKTFQLSTSLIIGAKKTAQASNILNRT